jgi:hypothetical protein
MKIRTKMLIAASLCALSLSANAGGACAVGYTNAANTWEGLYCYPAVNLTPAWVLTEINYITPNTTYGSCKKQSVVYTKNSDGTYTQKAKSLEGYHDYEVISVSNLGYCAGNFVSG